MSGEIKEIEGEIGASDSEGLRYAKQKAIAKAVYALGSPKIRTAAHLDDQIKLVLTVREYAPSTPVFKALSAQVESEFQKDTLTRATNSLKSAVETQQVGRRCGGIDTPSSPWLSISRR